MLGKEARKISPSKNELLDLVPPLRGDDEDDDERDEDNRADDRDRDAAGAFSLEAAQDPRAPIADWLRRRHALVRRYSMTGTAALVVSHVRWMSSSWPSAFSLVSTSFDALCERAAFRENHPELLLRALGGGELADDLAALELRGGDEEGSRQVDDDPVDLLRLERRDGVVVRVVDGGRPCSAGSCR